jgi:hypothetical protein
MQHTPELGKKGTSGSLRVSKNRLTKIQNRKSAIKPDSKTDKINTDDVSVHTSSDKEIFENDNPLPIREYH